MLFRQTRIIDEYIQRMKKEIKIAICAIAGLIILFFGMNFLKGLQMFSTDSKYYLTFEELSGLGVSTPIYASGYRVGVVTNIDYDYSLEKDITVEVDINPDMRIPKGSTAEITSDLLGNVQVNLKLNRESNETLPEGSTIKGEIDSGMMGKVKNMVPTIEKMLPKLDSIMVSINTLLADPAIAQSVHNVQGITNNLTTTTKELNALMAQLNRNVPTMMNKTSNVLDNATTLTGDLHTKLSAVDMEGTMNKVNATLANVETLTKRLNSNQGSLGLLMNDPSLYNNLNSTLLSADSLLVNFRQHPKRYVHFSVFGKKDK